MTTTLKNAIEGFVRYTKQTKPRRKSVRKEVLPPVVDYERKGAEAQLEQIAVMTGPLKERFADNKELVNSIDLLLAALGRLINSTPVAKTAVQSVAKQVPKRGVKRCVRVVENNSHVKSIAKNSLDSIFIDAAGRVEIQKQYGGGS